MRIGGLRLFHDPRLDRRRVGPQEVSAGEIEGVLVVAGGVVGRDVEGLEVVPVVLDLGARLDVVAHAQEDLLDPPAHDVDRVLGAAHDRDSREGDVDRSCGHRRGVTLHLDLAGLLHLDHGSCGLLRLHELRLDFLLELVEGLAVRTLLLVGQLAQGRRQLVEDAALLARIGNPDLLHLGGITPGRLEVGEERRPHLVKTRGAHRALSSRLVWTARRAG